MTPYQSLEKTHSIYSLFDSLTKRVKNKIKILNLFHAEFEVNKYLKTLFWFTQSTSFNQYFNGESKNKEIMKIAKLKTVISLVLLLLPFTALAFVGQVKDAIEVVRSGVTLVQEIGQVFSSIFVIQSI